MSTVIVSYIVYLYYIVNGMVLDLPAVVCVQRLPLMSTDTASAQMPITVWVLALSLAFLVHKDRDCKDLELLCHIVH